MIVLDKRQPLRKEFHNLKIGDSFYYDATGKNPDYIYTKVSSDSFDFNAIKFDIDIKEPILCFVPACDQVIPVVLEITVKSIEESK